MIPLISLSAVLPMVVFYLWMFRDMTNSGVCNARIHPSRSG
jgi:hypothetical protein